MSEPTADKLPKAALTFLSDLRDNNDKTWFDRNRKRAAAELVEPMRALVRGFCEEIPRLSPHFVGSDKKAGGSLTRLHRDVRFSKDKSPYHTHVGLHFWHDDAKKRELPGFFLRIDPDAVTVCTGMYGPEPDKLAMIRDRIVSHTKEWTQASTDKGFRKVWGGLDGSSLKRPPKGYPADHPAVEDLKRKDFVSFAELKAGVATRQGFVERVVDMWDASAPLMKFLCKAMDAPY